jgi:hypothetical protein
VTDKKQLELCNKNHGIHGKIRGNDGKMFRICLEYVSNVNCSQGFMEQLDPKKAGI